MAGSFSGNHTDTKSCCRTYIGSSDMGMLHDRSGGTSAEHGIMNFAGHGQRRMLSLCVTHTVNDALQRGHHRTASAHAKQYGMQHKVIARTCLLCFGLSLCVCRDERCCALVCLCAVMLQIAYVCLCVGACAFGINAMKA
jgi:hypothetical protein